LKERCHARIAARFHGVQLCMVMGLSSSPEAKAFEEDPACAVKRWFRWLLARQRTCDAAVMPAATQLQGFLQCWYEMRHSRELSNFMRRRAEENLCVGTSVSALVANDPHVARCVDLVPSKCRVFIQGQQDRRQKAAFRLQALARGKQGSQCRVRGACRCICGVLESENKPRCSPEHDYWENLLQNAQVHTGTSSRNHPFPVASLFTFKVACTFCSIKMATEVCNACMVSACSHCMKDKHLKGNREVHSIRTIPMCAVWNYQQATRECITAAVSAHWRATSFL